MTGIYIHVPFCIRKCPYCKFCSKPLRPADIPAYTAAVMRNISALSGKGITADTVYFGGGTPSLLPPESVEDILSALRSNITLVSPEITLEANPSSVTREKLIGWKNAGVNRLSFGVQSADDEELKFLGRLHDFSRAESTVRMAHEVGFDNISCDLMIGLKGQDSSSLDRTLDKMLRLPIMHLSAYMLSIEDGTAFDCEEVRCSVPDEDEVSDLYLQLCGRMKSAGFERYEISNWAKDGRRSRHNLKYWKLEPYIGIGASAHSDFGGRRYFCPDDIEGFMSAGVQRRECEDDSPDRFEEYVMLGLRISEGISRKRLAELGGEEAAKKIFGNAKPLIKAGLIEEKNGRIALTDKGALVSNAVITSLI